MPLFQRERELRTPDAGEILPVDSIWSSPRITLKGRGCSPQGKPMLS
jgi:hypothetical protein